MSKRAIRQSQALFPFGVGAIMDHNGESFVACDITEWTTPVRITEGRLEGILHVDHFRTPPKYNDRNPKRGIPYYRFPRWFFCPRFNCRKMRYLTYLEESGKRPVCLHCKTPLVPMRMVMACDRGHLSDVPWDYWAHKNTDRSCRDSENLEFRMKKIGHGGLDDLYIHCKTCDAKNDLSTIIRSGFKCQGRHPWTSNRETCEARTNIIQRNASNLRYDSSVEAISIPPHSNFDYWGSESVRIRNHNLFEELLKHEQSDPIWGFLIDRISEDLNVDKDLVEQVALNQLEDTEVMTSDNVPLYEGEYKAIRSPDVTHHSKDKFQKRKVNIRKYIKTIDPKLINEASLMIEMSKYISRIVIIDRLRCIRVLRGFYRISRDNFVPADIGKSVNWLPAIEYFGEGVFIEIESESLQDWENKGSVINRSRIIQDRYFSLSDGNREAFTQFQSFLPSPRFLLLHTMAHFLMIKMQFACGYSMSSIRERIYCSYPIDAGDEMSGILLFTSAGDAEGGMGGLARLGEPQNFIPTMCDAVYGSTVCSYDPVCIENPGQGLDGLNLAACHSCCLIPETSCTHRNQFLDRSMICGTIEDPSIGFFSSFLKEAEKIW